MSLYHSSDKADSSNSSIFQPSDFLNQIIVFFKKNPITILPIIFLLGNFPYTALNVKNHFTLYFLTGIFIFLIHTVMIFWACLTSKKNHIIGIFAVLLLLAVLRFTQLTTYIFDAHSFLPSFIEQIAYDSYSLGQLSFDFHDKSFLIYSGFGVLLVEISAIAFIVKKNPVLNSKDGVSKLHFLSTNTYIWLLFLLGLLSFVPVSVVKMNILDYESQMKYLGVKPGHIEVTAISAISPYYCSLSIGLSPTDATRWDSVDVTISGVTANGAELFKETRNIGLKGYASVSFLKPNSNCKELFKFVILDFGNFKSLDISNNEAALRSKYITFSMDEKYKQNTSLAPNLPKK